MLIYITVVDSYCCIYTASMIYGKSIDSKYTYSYTHLLLLVTHRETVRSVRELVMIHLINKTDWTQELGGIANSATLFLGWRQFMLQKYKFSSGMWGNFMQLIIFKTQLITYEQFHLKNWITCHMLFLMHD